MGRNNNSNKNIKLQIKSFLKKISLQLLKESMFLQFLRLDGKAFHTVGPALKKARSPKVSSVSP